MNYTDKALRLFHQEYNCAQSVFAPFASCCNLSEKQALALASGFGAGVGRMRGMCGAFSGLVMLCGMLKYEHVEEKDARCKNYELIQQLAAKFKEEFGTLNCSELLGLTVREKSMETAKPDERTGAYYQSRPCERCICFCAELGASLIGDR